MDAVIAVNDRKSTKVLIQPSPQPKQLTHLPQRPHVNIAFSDLTYTVREGRKKKEKIILKSVSGQLSSGELTAIMGPSGAGKSSLLNILTGYKTTGMKGSITINGEERNLNQFRKLSAYIMQDNQLHGNLTVGEAMNVATGLKLGREVNKDDRQEVIKEILDTLGLLEHSRTMTSNLSGGQKKRLSIALELVNNPPIMFFDEPTSGLDSSSCFQCIYLLKSLARGGRTIICTIHQPSARLFEMFDHLYTLADGQCVYQGSTETLVPFMATLDLVCPSYHNPASFIIEVACGEYGDNTRKLVNAIENGKFNIQEGKPFPTPPAEKLNNAIQEKSEGNANITVDPAPCATKRNSGSSSGNMNWFPPYVTNDIVKESINGDGQSNNMIRDELADAQKQDNVEISLLDNIVTAKQKQQAYPISEALQFWLVLRRTLLFSRRDWTLMYLRLFAHILVGLLIGALYYDIGNDGAKVLSNLGFLFFNMLFLMYTSMTITILSCVYIRPWLPQLPLSLLHNEYAMCDSAYKPIPIKTLPPFIMSPPGTTGKHYLPLAVGAVVPLEMPVLIKEHFNRWYSLRSYYLAITVSDLPFQAVFCVIYVAIVYYFTSQPPEIWRFAMFLAACLLISFVAQSVGLVVGAAMNVQNGVFLAPVMSVPFLLFSGFFVSFDAIPIYLRWITYLSYIRYGFEGTALATYGYAREKLKCHQTYCHFKAPETTLEELDMVNADFTIDIVALVVIFFVLRIAAFVFLRFKLMARR